MNGLSILTISCYNKTMYNPNRGNSRFGGGGDFRRQGFGRRGSSDREMFKVTCSKCGKDCEVPFRPTGERPVYCNDCFRTMRSDSPRFDNRDNRDSRGGSNTQDQFKKQFESLNWKLDKILKILSPSTPQEVVQPEKIEKKEEVVKLMKPKKSSKKMKVEKPAVAETP